MEENKKSRDNAAPEMHREDMHFRRQKQIIYRFFLSNTTTMYDAEKRTGVCRPNICRYVDELEREGKIMRIKKDLCPVSGHSAYYFKGKGVVQ